MTICQTVLLKVMIEGAIIIVVKIARKAISAEIVLRPTPLKRIYFKALTE